MKKYLSFFVYALQNSLVYRWNFFINIISKFILTLVSFYIWKVIFSSNAEINGYRWETMQLYIFISFICSASVSWNTEANMSKKIIEGSIAADLIKPVDITLMTFFQAAGESFIPNIFSIGIASCGAVLFCGRAVLIGASAAFFFLLSLLLSFLLNFTIVYIFSLFCFWTHNGFGIVTARAAISNFFSGMLIPLEFLPKLLFDISLFLPFKGIVHTPVSIFIGTLSGKTVLYAVIAQCCWLIALWFLSTAVYHQAVKHLSISGG